MYELSKQEEVVLIIMFKNIRINYIKKNKYNFKELPLLEEFLGSKDYKQLTLEQQILIKGYISELWNKLGEYLSTLNHSIITVEDIYHFINKYKDYFESLKEK